MEGYLKKEKILEIYFLKIKGTEKILEIYFNMQCIDQFTKPEQSHIRREKQK